MSTSTFLVDSPRVAYTDEFITAEYHHVSTLVTASTVKLVDEVLTFRTERRVPKTGLMLVGWGGNNGSTITASLMAHRHQVAWQDKEKVHTPDFLGSLTQSSTVRLGEPFI